MKQLQKILPIQSGYYLEDSDYDGFLSVIIPKEADNLVINPIMQDTNGDNKPDNWLIPDGGINPIVYIKIDGGPFWTHYFQYCWPGSGTISALVSDSIKGKYTASIWAKSDDNSKFFIKIFYNNGTSGIRQSSIEFRASNTWQQYSFTFDTGVDTGNSVELEIVGNDIYCLDVAAAQLEKGEYATTLIHGFLGNGYDWLGVPFGSSSRRNKNVIDGGRKINLKDLGMKLTSIEGLGLPDIGHSTTDLAFKYGSKYNGATIKERDFDMEFVLYSTSLDDLLCSRNKIGRAIFTLNQPRTFLWQPTDCGVPFCEPIKFNAVYKSGFSLGLNSHFGEEIKLNFTAYDIEMTASTQVTSELNTITSLVHSAIVGMDYYGNLKILPPLSTISPSIFQCKGMVVSPYDGNLYAIFSDGGPPSAPRGVVLCYNGVSWAKIAEGSTANGAMTAIHADGKYLYVAISLLQTITAGSGFSGTSGVGLTRINLAAKTVDNIGSLASGTTTARDGSTAVQPIIRAFATDENGNLYIAGNFTGLTTATSARHIAVYNGVSWATCGYDFSSSNGGINSLFYEKETKRLYVGGDYQAPSYIPSPLTQNVLSFLDVSTSISGTAIRTDFPLDMSGEPAVIHSITKYKNRIFVGGMFRSSYGYDLGLLDNVAFFDSNFKSPENVFGGLFPLGSRATGWGIDDAYAIATGISGTAPVYNLSVCDDELFISGKIQYYGIRSSIIVFYKMGEACGVVKFVSTAENAEIGTMMPDVAFGYVSGLTYTQCFMKQVICGSDKLGLQRFYATYLLASSNPTITSYTSQPNIITICDTDLPVSPRFILHGQAELTEITNQTYGLSLYFDYTIASNEIVIVDLTVSPPIINSSINGNIISSMLPASTPGAFKLFPGDNSIIVKSTWNTVDSNTKFSIQYTRQALSAESLCCDCPE